MGQGSCPNCGHVFKVDEDVSDVDDGRRYSNQLTCGGCGTEISYKSPSGCYLTTAAVEHKGRSDDCYELETMRHLRDDYILNEVDEGRSIVDEYYRTAPEIIRGIENATDDPSTVYDSIWQKINEIVVLIENNQYGEATTRYREMVSTLKQEYRPGA